MAFCSKCGNQILDNAKFCPKCGAPVAAPVNNEETRMYQQQPAQQPYQQPVQPSNGKSNQTLLYAIIGALAILLIGGCVYYFLNKNNEEMKAMSQQVEQLEQQKQEMAEKAKAAEEEAEVAKEEQKKAEEEAEKAKSAPQKIVQNEGAVHGAQHMAASTGSKVYVVINGTGVRLRFAPSLSAGYLTDTNGRNRSVPKGTKLNFNGYDDGDWYGVNYLGNTFYVSKQFSYLEYYGQ